MAILRFPMGVSGGVMEVKHVVKVAVEEVETF